MLYVNKIEASIVIKGVPQGTRSYLATLKDESGIHFEYDKEYDCYQAKVGITDFQIWLTRDGIRVRLVAGDMITLNQHYDHVHVDGIATIPDMYDAHGYILGKVAEITARFPSCDYLTRVIRRPHITVRRSLFCDGTDVVSAEYNLVYDRVEGSNRWTKIGDDFGTKGTTADRLLKRLRKDIAYFQEQGDRNFARAVQRADQVNLTQHNRELARSASAGIKGLDPLHYYYDHVTMQVDVTPDQLPLLAEFVRSLGKD